MKGDCNSIICISIFCYINELNDKMIEICGDEAKVEISTKFLREREFIGEKVETQWLFHFLQIIRRKRLNSNNSILWY